MKILIATGGSGGHIFPALHVARELRDRGHAVVFAGVLGPFKDKIKQEGFACSEIAAKGLKAESLKSSLQWAATMVKSICGSIRVLRASRPGCVIGFGGYGAFPLVLMAALMKVPAIIHEQNARPGRANRVLAPLAQRIAVSYPESVGLWPRHKTFLSGCPCRFPREGLSVQDSRRQFGLEKDRLTILVTGGSQGSKTINQTFIAALPFLLENHDVQVIHLTGEEKEENVRAFYAQKGIACFVAPFIEEMEAAYTAADLAVCRAGAVTISELAAFQVPAVIIPYPFAGGHQRDNARVLVEADQACLLEEEDMTAQTLAESVFALVERKREPGKFDEKLQEFIQPNAAKMIAVELEQLNG